LQDEVISEEHQLQPGERVTALDELWVAQLGAVHGFSIQRWDGSSQSASRHLHGTSLAA